MEVRSAEALAPSPAGQVREEPPGHFSAAPVLAFGPKVGERIPRKCASG